MKIGFFTDAYLPIGSGVTVSIESFRKNLEKMGHRIYIFAPYFPGYQDKNPRVFRFRSIKVIKKPEMRFALPFLPLENSLDKISEILKTKLDIVHAHDPFSLGFLGKLVANYQKIPFLYTHHTDLSEYAKFYIFKEKLISPYLAKVLTTAFSKLAQEIIVPSPKIKKYLIDCDIKKPIHILPTGVNLQIFKKSAKTKKEFRKKLGIDSQVKILLFVGRMGKEKNIEFLINAFKEVLRKTKESVILFLVGDGPDLEKFRQMSENLKINQFVHFTGQVPHKEILKYYQMADLFLFSSLTETQGIVILEAIASGLPVVALKDDAFKEFVIPNKNGFLIEKQSPKVFASKVLEILENPFLSQRFSDFSLKLGQLFSEKKQTEKLLAIYQGLTAGFQPR